MFNRIDPSVVSTSYGKYFGEIEISLKYKFNESTLLVKIGRAKSLQTPDVHKLPDSFVKASLIIKRYRPKQSYKINPLINCPHSFIPD